MIWGDPPSPGAPESPDLHPLFFLSAYVILLPAILPIPTDNWWEMEQLGQRKLAWSQEAWGSSCAIIPESHNGAFDFFFFFGCAMPSMWDSRS